MLSCCGRAGAGVHFESPDATTIDFTLQLNSTIKFFRGETQNPVCRSLLCYACCVSEKTGVGSLRLSALMCRLRFRMRLPDALWRCTGGLYRHAASGGCPP